METRSLCSITTACAILLNFVALFTSSTQHSGFITVRTGNNTNGCKESTQNYKREKICPFKVQKETRNIEQFLINHLQLHAEAGQKSHCLTGLE